MNEKCEFTLEIVLEESDNAEAITAIMGFPGNGRPGRRWVYGEREKNGRLFPQIMDTMISLVRDKHSELSQLGDRCGIFICIDYFSVKNMCTELTPERMAELGRLNIGIGINHFLEWLPE